MRYLVTHSFGKVIHDSGWPMFARVAVEEELSKLQRGVQGARAPVLSIYENDRMIFEIRTRGDGVCLFYDALRDKTTEEQLETILERMEEGGL